MSEHLTPAELALLVPRDCIATYRLDGYFDLLGADGSRRYHLQQARLFDVADCGPDGTYSRFLGVVIRRKAGQFIVKGANRQLGIIEAGYFTDENGERYRLIAPSSAHSR